MITHVAWYDLRRRRQMKVKVKDAVAEFAGLSDEPPNELILNEHHREVSLPDNTIPVRFEPFVPKGVVYVGRSVDGVLGLVRVAGPDAARAVAD